MQRCLAQPWCRGEELGPASMRCARLCLFPWEACCLLNGRGVEGVDRWEVEGGNRKSGRRGNCGGYVKKKYLKKGRHIKGTRQSCQNDRRDKKSRWSRARALSFLQPMQQRDSPVVLTLGQLFFSFKFRWPRPPFLYLTHISLFFHWHSKLSYSNSTLSENIC